MNSTLTDPAPPMPVRTVVDFRQYQLPIFNDRGPGVIVMHWARQIGKSFTLAAWAVDRLLEKEKEGHLVTVLSNSRENGAEFLLKCAEVCRILGQKFQIEETSADTPFQQMRMEIRVKRKGRIGRIKVLAANPRTARGFSGDLILDEFAFHEDSAAIWEAAEPILASNPDFKCRIASTSNGRYNMFYRMVSGCNHATRNTQYENTGGNLYTSANGFTVSKVSRTSAYNMGVKIFSLTGHRREISPAEARAAALDKRAYDQNYECVFANENMTLLTHELISAAQSDAVAIDFREWSAASIARMQRAAGALEVGNDIGRNRDLSMVTVIERDGQLRRVIAMLRMEDMRLPDQQRQVAVVCRMHRFRAYCGDMTGLGLGLVEYLQEQFGRSRIHGVNFSSTEPAGDRIKLEGRKQETARVTEIMAVNLLACFEDRSIKDLPNDPLLTDDLRKPEKITSPGGRVSIAATRDEAGHADGFWSLALAVRAGEISDPPFVYQPVILPRRRCLIG